MRANSLIYNRIKNNPALADFPPNLAGNFVVRRLVVFMAASGGFLADLIRLCEYICNINVNNWNTTT